MEDAFILARTLRFLGLSTKQGGARIAIMRLESLFANDPQTYNTGMYE